MNGSDLTAAIAARMKTAQDKRKEALVASTESIKCFNALLLNGMGVSAREECLKRLEEIQARLSTL